jgi:beta-lactamase regulating signal transducer with metallopeptidase domain
MLALLLESALRLLVLGGAVWLGLRLLRVRNPHVQMTVWSVVLLASLSMPALMRWMTVTIPVGPPPAQLARIVSASQGLPLEALHSLQAMHSLEPTISPAHPSESAAAPSTPSSQPGVSTRRFGAATDAVDWWGVATTIYLVVAGVLLLRLLVGVALTWRLVRKAQPIHEWWAAGADVRVSDTVGMPVTFGSTILLPPECLEWNPAKRQAVLSHEGAHVAHGDFYVLLLAVLNRAVFWFSPFAWWQLRRLADLAEIISDDAAIEVLRDRPSYAGILLDVASNVPHAPAGLAMARARTVPRRVERILAVSGLPATLGWRRRALIAMAIVPLVAVSAATIARGTTTERPPSIVSAPATSTAQAAPVPATYTPPPAEGAQAAVDATRLDGYVGHYQVGRRAILTITRADDQLFAQMTGQRKLPLQPASNGEYAFGSSPARISFVADAQGTVTTLVLQQSGRIWPSMRVDEAKATAIEGVFARQIAAAPERFRDQLPAQGSKDAVRRTIEELQRGSPTFERMSRPLAENMGRQLAHLHAMLTALGAAESIFFRGVGPGGYDIYGAKFANGFAEFRLLMGADGTIEDLLFRPDGDDTPGGVASCADEASLKSSPDTAPIRVMLFNGTGADIHLFSVDFAGHRTRHATISNEQSGWVLTYIARPWIVADASGKCLEIVWPGQHTRYLAVPSVQALDQPDRPIAPRRTPTSGGEEALRRYIDELARGEPDYDRMTAEVAGDTRRQLLLNQAILAKLGPVRAMSFRGVTPFGSDIYMVQFAKGSAEWRIALLKDGRIGRIALGPQY